MKTHDLQTEKLDLISWITQLQDISIIEKLKKLRAKNASTDIIIPQWQQEEVNKRLSLVEKGEMKTRSWDEAKKDIFQK
jgi:hypothetical protein